MSPKDSDTFDVPQRKRIKELETNPEKMENYSQLEKSGIDYYSLLTWNLQIFICMPSSVCVDCTGVTLSQTVIDLPKENHVMNSKLEKSGVDLDSL
jgi:hypothetical protein